MTKYKLLFYSHDGPMPASLRGQLERAEIGVTVARTWDEVSKELASNNYDLCVERGDSISKGESNVLQYVQDKNIPVRVILSAKDCHPQEAVRAIKAGAADVVLEKSMESSLLTSIVETLSRVRKTAEPKTQDGVRTGLEAVLIGRSKPMEEVYSAIDLVANSQTAVLITGESGTGKEMVARTMHLKSDRANKPFFAINCAAFPKDVIENELFGHERGAFTGALIKKQGAFELANGGTLFFDEIAEMNPETQAKLLRVIEYKAFRRLGGNDEVNVDVRMVAATNKSIGAALKSGEFREDLYYRFSVIEIALPPLRDRKEDIPLLVDYFLTSFREKYRKEKLEISDEVRVALENYDWPGNVRELRNIVERMVVTCPGSVILPHQLPPGISNNGAGAEQFVHIRVGTSVEEAEKIVIQQTLAHLGNNKSKAARVLGLSRKTLHNKLNQYKP